MSAKEKKKTEKKDVIKLIITLIAIALIIILLYVFGAFEYLSVDNLRNLQEWINDFGALAPVIFILLYIAACLFFLPGLPVALLAGFAFGPVRGAAFALIGATLGATAAFLVARYAARGMVEGWIQKNKQLRKIDEGVKKQGWRMLVITRSIPIFPFNVQNYVYGLTDIKLFTYFIISFIFMAPGAIAYTFMAGSVAAGEGIGNTLLYLSIGALFFIIITFIPGYIKKKKGIGADIEN